MQLRLLQRWIPELLLAVLSNILATRQLGTFPAVWEDSGIHLVMARTFAEAGQYALPLMGEYWSHAAIAAVGPTVIVPVALAIKLFGFSVGVARVPMVLYLILTAAFLYLFAKRIAGVTIARLTVLLTITLSAFINTGKPILGEVPALCFLSAGLWLWVRGGRYQWLATGMCIGLAVITKITLAVTIPLLLLAVIAAMCTKEYGQVRQLLATTMVSLFLPLVWYSWAELQGGEVLHYLQQRIADNSLTSILLDHPSDLLRFQFVYFGAVLTTGWLGIWQMHKNIGWPLAVFLWSLSGAITMYFLLGPGWYRHALYAHVVLIPFIPIGVRVVVGSRGMVITCLALAVVQGYWQLGNRGATPTLPDVPASLALLKKDFADTPLMIRQSELFAQLPANDNWIFLPYPEIYQLIPPARAEVVATDRCLPQVWKLGGAMAAFSGSVIPLSGRYGMLLPLEGSCTAHHAWLKQVPRHPEQ